MLACFFSHKNVAALVRTALAAGTMGKLALMAVRALGEAGGGQKIVAAALGSSLFGVAPFRIRHCSIPFDRPCRLREETCERKHRPVRQKLDFSASTRACPPDPQAHSNANQPEPRRRNILLD